MLTADALAEDGEVVVWREACRGNADDTILRIDTFLFLALMKPLAQFRRFLGREFSLLLPPNFQARFFILADLKGNRDNAFKA
jgi:hypothetical protein